jgi:hypothetical protein
MINFFINGRHAFTLKTRLLIKLMNDLLENNKSYN